MLDTKQKWLHINNRGFDLTRLLRSVVHMREFIYEDLEMSYHMVCDV